ncbi:cytochrome b5-like [Maniola hyperantus]|uniref:cytochrome b5-like n=1 Tax=Aphantopus hyperantus TaxID=2795564 RepID=UPI001568A8DC|nr:cytochrome b5-like [Maniola hyperantus]
MSQRLTRAEVARRRGRDDAAIVIDNVVYDVTRFLDEHPGGADILLDNAGEDAFRCFHDVGHSEDAKLWRAQFAVGEVVEEERREVLAPPAAAAEAERAPSLRALLDVLAPPLLLAGLAVLVYIYLFSRACEGRGGRRRLSAM